MWSMIHSNAAVQWYKERNMSLVAVYSAVAMYLFINDELIFFLTS
jgi:hypothetical protein